MKTSKNSSKTRMPQRHPFIPSPHLKMNLFHSPSICQMENLGLLLAGRFRSCSKVSALLSKFR
jgi:hypothetical protein